MKKINIRNIRIQNFKGCKELFVRLGERTEISGANASGKTTIFDACTWLLFNKDSLGNTKFEIRPLEDGKQIDNIEISVEMLVEVDGVEYLLKKVQTQKWVKKRGSDERKFEGNVNEFEINEYPKSEKEFKEFIAGIGDVVHCVYGSRYLGYTDEYGNTPFFALRYTHTTLEKVLTDTWEESVVIDVGHWDESTATMKTDCGYPSIWKDENNNLYAVYYDSDESGLAYGANWRLLFGNPYVQKKAVEDSGKGAKNVAYSQAQVDLIISGLMTKINELYMLVGQMPEDDVLDGSQPVYSGLVEWFESGDSSQWSEDGTIKSKVNSGYSASNSGTGNYNYAIASGSKPDTYSQNIALGGLLFDALLTDYGIENECSIEFLLDMNDNQYWSLLKENKTTTPNTFYYYRNNNFSNGYDKTACHIVVIFTLESTKLYYNGNLCETKDPITEEQFANAVPLIHAVSGGIGGVRMYNRALTDDEIKNNYQYASTLTEIGSESFA